LPTDGVTIDPVDWLANINLFICPRVLFAVIHFLFRWLVVLAIASSFIFRTTTAITIVLPCINYYLTADKCQIILD